MIPRTQRLPPKISAHNPNSEEFIKKLRDALEKFRIQRLTMQQCNLADPSDFFARIPQPPSNQCNQKNQSYFNGQLVAAMQQLEEDDQSILDHHVSRIWSDSTPHRSPGTKSPCPAVPSRRRPHDPITTGGDGNDFFCFSNFIPI